MIFTKQPDRFKIMQDRVKKVLKEKKEEMNSKAVESVKNPSSQWIKLKEAQKLADSCVGETRDAIFEFCYFSVINILDTYIGSGNRFVPLTDIKRKVEEKFRRAYEAFNDGQE